MARLKTAIQLEQERIETLQKLTNDYPIALYTKRPAIIQARYSTVRQYTESVEAGLEQSEKLLQRAIDLGWARGLISHILVENKLTKDGRIRNVSGTIPIDDRPGMNSIIDLIKADEAGALFCDDVSRLTRDADLVDATTLARVCRQHDCIIVTSERIYNFSRKGDFEAYIEEARGAASWLETHQKGKMLRNRTRKAEQGRLATGIAPVGLMRDETGDNLKPSPHASRVDWLYARCRAHNACLNNLLRELKAMADSGKPVFPVVDVGIPKYCTPVYQGEQLLGWTITSRFGLKHVLTNPAYQGHLVFNGKIMKRNAFPAIVDALNWQWCFDALAGVDLDGQPIERPEKQTLHTQQSTGDHGALLYGSRQDGRAVIDGLNGLHVYVHLKPVPAYTLSRWSVSGYETSISMSELDHIVEQKMLSNLKVSEFLTLHYQQQAEYNENWRQLADAVDGSNQIAQPDDTETTLDEDIAKMERKINIGSKYMNDKELEAAYAKLARLRNRKAAREQARANQERMRQEIKRATNDLCLACDQWHSWDIDRKRGLIRLVTQSITLEEIAVGWLRLTIQWSSVLGGQTEQAYIRRITNSRWTDNDLAALREYFPTATKNELLDMFPVRSWTALLRQARERGIKRTVIDTSHVDNDVSRNDVVVAARYGVSVGKRVQWVLAKVTAGDCPP